MHAHTYALVLLFFVGEIPKRGLVGPNNIHIFILGDIAILVFFKKLQYYTIPLAIMTVPFLISLQYWMLLSLLIL